MKLQDIPGEGILVKTYNLTRKIKIKHPLVQLAKESSDNVLYLEGTLDRNDVFVKKVPIKVDCNKSIEVYRSCSHIANVVNLRSVERDHHFIYMAFEKTEGSVVKFVEDDQLVLGSRYHTPYSRPLRMLRYSNEPLYFCNLFIWFHFS